MAEQGRTFEANQSGITKNIFSRARCFHGNTYVKRSHLGCSVTVRHYFQPSRYLLSRINWSPSFWSPPLHPLRCSRTCSGSKRKLEDFLMALVQFSPCPVTSANRDSTKKWRLISMKNADVFPAVACLRRRPETTGNSSAFAYYGTFETATISAENSRSRILFPGGYFL